MPTYDRSQFEPPAPIAQVRLRNLETGIVQINVAMLLDTGADVTLIPQSAAKQLGATASRIGYELTGFDGQTSVAAAVQLELVFCRRLFQGQFLLIEQEYGVLGRNILNVVPLIFDGPNLTWGEQRR